MRPLVMIVLVALCFGSLGCAGRSLKPLTGGAIQPGAVFYVAPHEKDERQLELVIADAMREQGCSVSDGPEHLRPQNAYLVTYVDRWNWDVRLYLEKIVISVQDVESGAILGESERHQGSMSAMGETYESVIRDVTSALFKCDH